MTPLGRLLSQRIAASGPLGVDAFIAEALGHPQFGYYRQAVPIGRAGDFITAPEISQVFGELLGLWAVTVWEAMGRPALVRLIELGPGHGVLLADALRAIARVRPQALPALALHLVEIHAGLRQEQARRLEGAGLVHPVAWHTAFNEVPPGPAIVIANEFFDCLPIRQFVRRDGAWCERVIALDASGDFVFTQGAPALLDLPATLADCAEDDVIELCPAAAALMQVMAERLTRDGGAALIIDYGYAKPSFGETLQAVRHHRSVAPLTDPGEADLSHHVDFAALHAAAVAAGAMAYGPIAQGLFLGRLGIDIRAQALVAAAPGRAQEIEGRVRRLMHPGRMGVLFKVLAITDPTLPPPPGFAPVA